MQEYFTETSSNICFGYSNKYPKYMFCEEIRIKHGLSYISFYPLVILYNKKFSLMVKFLETNAVVVTWVHCMCIILCTILFRAYERKSVNITLTDFLSYA